MPALQARGLSRSYVSAAETVAAVDAVDLDLYSGELVCLYGTSGSGKSTLLHLLAGLLRPDRGSVLIEGVEGVEGVDLVDADERTRARIRRTHLGVVFQHDNLLDEFTAAENVALPLEITGRSSSEALSEAEQSLARVGLDGLGRRRPDELSGGQRQRVGIARALVGGRAILLADEPSGALDSSTSRSLFRLLAGLAEDGTAILVVSHDPECRAWAGRALEMVDGRLTSAGVTA